MPGEVGEMSLVGQSDSSDSHWPWGRWLILKNLSTMQVSDHGLIIPEFPTNSLLCAFHSIIDLYLNYIHLSVLEPYVLCNWPARWGSEHRIKYYGSRIWLTVPHSQVWPLYMTNILWMGPEFPVIFLINRQTEIISVAYHPSLSRSYGQLTSPLPCSA